MRWYVSRNGETVGPIEERHIVEWIRAGMRDGMVRDEEGGQWMALAQSPFGQFVPSAFQPSPGGETLGVLALLTPIAAASLMMLGVTKMGAAILVTIGTSLLIAFEASSLGMGVRPDSRGKMGSSPANWFLSLLLLWAFAFPWYFDRRRYYGRWPLAIPAIFVTLFFLWFLITPP